MKRHASAETGKTRYGAGAFIEQCRRLIEGARDHRLQGLRNACKAEIGDLAVRLRKPAFGQIDATEPGMMTGGAFHDIDKLQCDTEFFRRRTRFRCPTDKLERHHRYRRRGEAAPHQEIRPVAVARLAQILPGRLQDLPRATILDSALGEDASEARGGKCPLPFGPGMHAIARERCGQVGQRLFLAFGAERGMVGHRADGGNEVEQGGKRRAILAAE